LIHFDLDDRYQDENVVGSALARRDGVALAILFHAFVLALFIFGPKLEMFQPSQEELQQRQAEIERQQREEAQRRFVFVQPRVDMRSIPPPPPRSELSDQDRRAQAPRLAPQPTNPAPFSRGNSSERTEAAVPETARGEPQPQPEPEPTPPQPEPERQVARALPPADTGLPRRSENESRPLSSGRLGEALRNLQQYVQKETFNNPQGGANTPGATIQFDTKGVEFGPWLRRFVAQVRRNWFVPLAAYTMHGHVVLQFNIHKDGTITDVNVIQPSSIQSFNIAAVNAIQGSSPTEPLPPEYPSPMAFFTVTFYYNEDPGN
jgi:TonB family protein